MKESRGELGRKGREKEGKEGREMGGESRRREGEEGRYYISHVRICSRLVIDTARGDVD